MEKINYFQGDEIFRPILYYYFNDKKNLLLSRNNLEFSIQMVNNDYHSLISLLVFYLIEGKPDNSAIINGLRIINKAYSGGYRLLAYEAAYVMKQWVNDKETIALYEKIAKHFNFQPALSYISKQEEWEKALNAFLSISSGKGNASGKDEQGKYRVVYFVNFNGLYIQPVLQTLTAKGAWSSGRNIALKKFYQGNVEGMTQQDLLVARKVKYSSGYYSADEYYLENDAIKELIGHPYVFLNGTNDLSVELIAAQPVLQVTRIPKGYTLSTDISKTSENLIVIKETNTRYKIYDLTDKQRSVIEAIKQQKITVPEHGKEKLMQVLGIFSSHFLVHSDLSVSENTKFKKVIADSRIRVQLLPLGEGLKAELFAKPFGNHPPYCKPGKGGKTLIASERGEQLQVTRDLDLESNFAYILLEKIQSLESVDMNDDLIAFGNPLDSLHLLDILAMHQYICIVEWPEGERFKIKGTVNFSNLNLKIKTQTNWFELQGELKVDEDTVLTVKQLLQLTEKGHGRFIELKPGEFLALSERLKKQLDELHTFSTEGKDGVYINKFASVALGDFFDEADNLKTDKSWKEFKQRLDLVQNTDRQLPANLQADLRPYQADGFRWLSRLAEWDAGACLSDDMGLGKTIQALAILLQRSHKGAALVICPVSVIHNWISETAKFAPSLKVKTLSTLNREQTLQTLEPGDLLISSYGLLQSEEKAFAQTPFATIVLDEAHTIKNYTTKTSKAAMQLQAPFRLLLTGTPIQNHLGEIWNLFNFINPGLLGSLTHFTDTFIKPDNDHARKHLKKLIAPFILRRTKSSVMEELPAKTEIIRKVELSSEEMAFYEALRRQAIENLESDNSQQGAKHLKALAEITRLRQACCNPALVNPEINISSAKLSTFLEIVAELIENKHKALVFSQFVTHLALVRQALDSLGIRYQYLDGSCSQPDRQRSVNNFQGGDGDLFLISLKAGGLGLNLTAADYVIHLDPWWNPAVEDQASDRAHRIGQIRPVTIYRLVAQNTIEEKIIQLHNTKRDMADTLLEGSDQPAKLSMAELVSLIKDRD
ncbi:MAG: DEAD/DEAH box helicase [Bacteroidetes bacterium]|nr:DEAD/DEAH box helicase [Bacteroidota bacterium]